MTTKSMILGGLVAAIVGCRNDKPTTDDLGYQRPVIR